ncbi:MAG: SAM-dependent methyltransferase [Streptomycetales bacterium]
MRPCLELCCLRKLHDPGQAVPASHHPTPTRPAIAAGQTLLNRLRKDPGIDPTKPSPARMYDYWLGGKDNYAADREAAERVVQVFPEVRHANRQFLVRTVRYCAEQGDQLIDIGAGLPTPPNVHEVSREIHPHAGVVAVDNDPVVLNHNQALVAVDEGLATIEGRPTRPRADPRQPRTAYGDRS